MSFYNFFNAHKRKEVKTFNLSYHFFINYCASLKQTASLEILNMCCGFIIEAMKFISYNNTQ